MKYECQKTLNRRKIISFLVSLIMLIALLMLMLSKLDEQYDYRCLNVWGAGKCVEFMSNPPAEKP